MVQAYCVKCRKKTDMTGAKKVKIQTRYGTRAAMKGTCKVCGTKMNLFVKS